MKRITDFTNISEHEIRTYIRKLNLHLRFLQRNGVKIVLINKNLTEAQYFAELDKLKLYIKEAKKALKNREVVNDRFISRLHYIRNL